MEKAKAWNIETNPHGFVYVVDHDGNKICSVFGTQEQKTERAIQIADIPVLMQERQSA